MSYRRGDSARQSELNRAVREALKPVGVTAPREKVLFTPVEWKRWKRNLDALIRRVTGREPGNEYQRRREW